MDKLILLSSRIQTVTAYKPLVAEKLGFALELTNDQRLYGVEKGTWVRVTQ